MAQKDLNTRVIEIIDAWERMRPHKSFFGLTLDGFKLKAKPYLDARKAIELGATRIINIKAGR